MEEQRQRQEEEARKAREASGTEGGVKTETIKEGKFQNVEIIRLL